MICGLIVTTISANIEKTLAAVTNEFISRFKKFLHREQDRFY